MRAQMRGMEGSESAGAGRSSMGQSLFSEVRNDYSYHESKYGQLFNLHDAVSSMHAVMGPLVDSMPEEVDLSGKLLLVEGAKELAASLVKAYSKVNVVKANDCDMGPDGAIILIGTALASNSNITVLQLDKNNIGDQGAFTIGSILTTNSVLRTLSLRNNHISCKGASFIGKALQANSKLHTLNLYYNNIGDAGAIAIAAGLAQNQALKQLYLHFNNIKEEGGKAIGVALMTNQKLHTLFLWHNQIKNVGAQAIAEALMVNKTLRSLHLGSNSISDQGAVLLGNGLCVNKTLRKINLNDNYISLSGKGGLALARALDSASGCKIHVLTLHGNDPKLFGLSDTSNSGGIIAAALSSNISLHTLDLSACKLQDEAVGDIAISLSANVSIHTLNLSSNFITDQGAMMISMALLTNRTINKLHLHGNLIGEDGCVALLTALESNGIVNVVTLNGNSAISQASIDKISELLQRNQLLSGCFSHPLPFRDRPDRITTLRHIRCSDLFVPQLDILFQQKSQPPTTSAALDVTMLTSSSSITSTPQVVVQKFEVEELSIINTPLDLSSSYPSSSSSSLEILLRGRQDH